MSSSKVEDRGDACTGDSPTSPKPSATPCRSVPSASRPCVHPVRLPCRHVFCFLCVKGASWHSKRCALCRQEVPEDFLEHPTLLSPEELKAAAAGRRERSRAEERAGGDKTCLVLRGEEWMGGSRREDQPRAGGRLRQGQEARAPRC
ncbi:hypothetical protein J4Q44_G00320800 [Coregonus suidteri]|uniref:E3 ubiquitin-protein ligase n=1 Tax=Coregonus suidteri TaxID=861788 RepID=A0AAN8KRL1_9TELE